MDFYIVIPAHNEEAYLTKTLQSLATQTLLPKKIVVVNDSSSDETQNIIDSFSEKFNFIEGIFYQSEKKHEPGSKVIHAFHEGYQSLDDSYDVICKFDADLIFPNNYLEKISEIFQTDSTCGMAGGFCYIEKNGEWILENLTNKDHIRGALKAYTKACFSDINGLRKTMGWDTVDEIIAQHKGWKVKTDESLRVKHLKPTGKAYSAKSRFKQGEAFYKMRYGFLLTVIASAKLGLKKKNFPFFKNTIQGYFKAKNNNTSYILSEEEGEFIRNLRWKNIKKKIF